MELRLYESNLAVLPAECQAFQWRLAEVDAVRRQEESSEVILESGDHYLRITQLGKRTDDFTNRVREAIASLNTKSVQALHHAFPFLDPDQLQAVAALLREGRSAAMAKLAAIHPRIAAAVASNAVDEELKPYYDDLLGRTATGMLYTGFKLIRPEERHAEDDADGSTEPGERAPPWRRMPMVRARTACTGSSFP